MSILDWLSINRLVGSKLKLVWAWHSSAPACFQLNDMIQGCVFKTDCINYNQLCLIELCKSLSTLLACYWASNISILLSYYVVITRAAHTRQMISYQIMSYYIISCTVSYHVLYHIMYCIHIIYCIIMLNLILSLNQVCYQCHGIRLC